jgi:hypothetical protein
VSDTARVLLTASGLTLSGFALLTWRLTRLDAAGPERLVGQFRLTQYAALLLAATAGVSIGLVIANESAPLATVEVTLAVAFILLAGFVLHREPRDGLLVVAGAFVLHALIDIAHRPGWLWPGYAPRWYAVGCAVFDICVAALCYWATRR